MKKAICATLLSLACQARFCMAKEIKTGTKDYDDAKNWNVGDEVEGFGTVVKKTVKGRAVKITFKSEGIEYIYEETQK